MSHYTLDDLPRFSPWPARLLGLAPWDQKEKTSAEIEREFGREKWGSLLARAEAEGNATLARVDCWVAADSPATLVSTEDGLELMTAPEAHERYVDHVARAIEPFLPAPAVVELGCGYGSVILGLALRERFQRIPLFAADYTRSGPALAALIAAAEGVALQTGRCDIAEGIVSGMQVPPGAIIFTAYAAQYVRMLAPRFGEGLAALQPRSVVHIEPVYEHCDDGLLGLMRRRYIELNGYNRNLLTVLRELESHGTIRIISEAGAAFGPNPFLAASTIVWSPSDR